MSLNDRYLTAGKQARVAVEKSRAWLVGEVIYPNVDESRFAALFSNDKGSRPNIPIRVYFCALVLKRMYGLSDEVLIELIRCGALEFQYALHTTDDDSQPLSLVSLSRFRRKIAEYDEANGCDLVKDEYTRISQKIAKAMPTLPRPISEKEEEADADRSLLARMDSMMIEAHAKVMPRVEILYTTIQLMLRLLVKEGLRKIIPANMKHYLEDDDKNASLYFKGDAKKRAGLQLQTTARLLADMDQLAVIVKNIDVLKDTPTYKVFFRVLDEQSFVDKKGVRHARDKKDIAPDSVQNPYDAAETYRNKRGPHHGYALNIEETIDGKGNGILTNADYQPNNVSDSAMVKKHLDSLPDDGQKRTMIADGAYSGDEAARAAEEKNVNLFTTNLTGKLPDESMADFELSEDGKSVLKCPKGYVPYSCTWDDKRERFKLAFSKSHCANCPYAPYCKGRDLKRKPLTIVCISPKTIARARTVRFLGTDVAKAMARKRNGIEGVMSVLRRKYRLDEIPVFGIIRSSLWVWTSLLSYNLVKLQKYLQSLAPDECEKVLMAL
jgi:hypothetical protein